MKVHMNIYGYYIYHTHTYIITYTNEVIHANIHVQMQLMEVHMYTKCNIIILY